MVVGGAGIRFEPPLGEGVSFSKGMAHPKYGVPVHVMHLSRSGYNYSDGAESFEVPKNHIIIYEPERPIFITPLGENRLCYDWVTFRLVAATAYGRRDERLFNVLAPPLGVPVPVRNPAGFSNIFSEIYGEFKQNGTQHGRIIDLLIKWLVTKFAEEADLRLRQSDERLRTACGYAAELDELRLELQREPQRAWTSEAAAKRLNVCLSHFQHLYRRRFGNTFVQDIIAFRIERAKALLITTRHSVSEISELCGYNDVYHFIKQFGAKTGSTPDRYRRRFVK